MLLSVFSWIRLKLLILLFRSYFLTLSSAVIQLFITLSQTPSTHLLPDTGVKGCWRCFHAHDGHALPAQSRGKETLQKETPGEVGALCRDPFQRWRGFLCAVVPDTLLWWWGRQRGSPATRQSRAGGFLLAEPLFFLSHMPLSDWKSLVSHKCLVWLSVAPALVCNPRR